MPVADRRGRFVAPFGRVGKRLAVKCIQYLRRLGIKRNRDANASIRLHLERNPGYEVYLYVTFFSNEHRIFHTGGGCLPGRNNTLDGNREYRHARHILVYGATITPFGGSGYDSPSHRTTRQTVNAWIRTNELYDAVIDFDAALRNPSDPEYLLPAYNNDNLHPNITGYEALGDAVDLNLFTP